MSYVLLIVEGPDDRRNRTLEEGKELYARMVGFGESLQARGLLKASESLRLEGTRIDVRGGTRRMMDGPFAEAKELVGGFFLLNCEDREQALAIAAECPALEWATVELRQTAPCFEI